MSSFSISSVINSSFVARFSRMSGAASSNTSDSEVKYSSTDQVDLTLDAGNRTLTQAYQNLGNAAGFVTASEETLKKLDKIVGKVITLAESAGRSSTSSGGRAQITAEYKKLASEFSKVARKAKLGDFDLLNRDDLASVLSNVGLDPTRSASMAKAFKKFVFPPSKKSLAETETSSSAPVSVPSNPSSSTPTEPETVTVGTVSGNFKDAQLADVNNDQILDLVSYSDGLKVQLGVGDGTFGSVVTGPSAQRATGTFQSPLSFSSGTMYISNILEGDFNNDGIIDLISTRNAGTGLAAATILAGNGDGTFKTGVSIGGFNLNNTQIRDAATGDYNGDGKLDLFFATTGGFAIQSGNGNGTFAGVSVGSFPGTAPTSVAVADFNGDGLSDTVFGLADGSVQVGGIVIGGLDTYVSDVSVADVNNDGLQDIIATTGSNVWTILNQDGGFYAAQPRGSTPATISGVGVASIAVTGDFNRDGKVDVVTESAILLGNGDGTFQAAQSVATGPDYAEGSAADVNDDGILDIVRPRYTLLGNGDGSFRAGSTVLPFLGGGGPASLVAADLNSDGVVDLATNYHGGDGNVQVILGSTTTENGAGANLTLKDLNGDNKLDAIFSGGYNSSNVFYAMGKGNGSFEAARALEVDSVAQGVYDFQVGDFWGADGKLDIAVGSPADPNKLVVFRGNGNGTFSSETTTDLADNLSSQIFRGGNGTSATGDFNNDSKLDYITTTPDGTVLALGTGQGTFSEERINNIAGSALTVGSFDGDSKADDIAQLVFRNTGTFKAGVTVSSTVTADNFTVADFNGDGIDDLVASDSTQNALAVFIGKGDGTYNSQLTVSGFGVSQRAPTAADLNGDGKMDLVIRQYVGGEAYSLLGNGNGTFSVADTITGLDEYGGEALLADITGDGIADLLTQGFSGVTGRYSVLYAAGNAYGTFGSAVTALTSTTQSFWGFNVSDVNNDGKTDLIVGDRSTGNVLVSLGNNNGTFGAVTTIATGAIGASGFAELKIGDLNGDGNTDVVVARNQNSTMSVILGNGNGSFKASVSYSAASDLRQIVLADVNGDGITDITGASPSGNAISMWQGNGNGTFQARTTTAVGQQALSFAISDTNNDGTNDLIVGSTVGFKTLSGNGQYTLNIQTSDNVQYANDGSFKAVTPTVMTNVPAGSSGQIVVADLNKDGFDDIVQASFLNFYQNTVISVSLGKGNGSFTSPTTLASSGVTGDVSVADINNDGFSDIVVKDDNTDIVSFLGSSNGTFGAAVSSSTGGGNAGGQNLLLGDVTGDGIVDAMGVEYSWSTGGTNVGLMAGVGNGTFSLTTSQLFSGITNITAAQIADLNNDGRLDVISGGSDGKVRVNRAYVSGANTYVDVTQAVLEGGIGAIHEIEIADLNNDATLDLVIRNTLSERGAVLLGVNNGTYQAAVSFSTQPWANRQAEDMELTDINGDGNIDLVAALDYGNAQAMIMTGNGDGTFAAATSIWWGGNYWKPAGGYNTSIAVSDINNDGTKDILVAGYYDSTGGYSTRIATFLGNGKLEGTFATTDVLATVGITNPANATLVSGQFTDDTKTDLLLTTDAGVFLYSGNADGTFADAVTYDAGFGTGVGPLATGDTNSDNNSDVLAVSLKADGTFSQGQILSAGNYGDFGYGDFNQDGNQDLIATGRAAFYDGTASSWANEATIFLGSGAGTYALGVTFSLLTNAGSAKATFTPATDFVAEDVLVTDTNGDGYDDIITANGAAGSVSLALGNGNGTFKTAISLTPATTGGRITSLAYADYDGDSKKDIIYNDVINNRIGIFTGNGNGTFKTNIASYELGARRADKIIAANFDADGAAEIVATDVSANSLTVLLGNGAGSFKNSTTASITLLGSTAETFDIAALDYNNDGSMDIAATFTNRAGIAIVQGNGNGTFAAATSTASSLGAGAELKVADVNADGLSDLVATETTLRMAVGVASGSTYVSIQNAATGLEESYTETAAGVTAGVRVALGDIDGDGVEETITASGSTLTIKGLTINMQGSPFTGDAISIATGDLDGDGKTDIAVGQLTATPGASQVKILRGSDLSNNDMTAFYTAGSWHVGAVYTGGVNLAIGDLNGDGKLDLTMASAGNSSDNGFVGTILGNGNGTFKYSPEARLDWGGPMPTTVAMGDVNGDGKSEIIFTENTGYIWAYEHLAQSSLGLIRGWYGFGSWTPPTLATADINGDGKAEVFAGSGDNNEIRIFEGSSVYQPGAPQSGSPTLLKSFTATNSTAGVNIALSPEAAQQTTSVLLNQGNKVFSVGESYTSTKGVKEVAVFDANKDGVNDITLVGGRGVSTMLGDKSGTIKLRKSGSSGGGGTTEEPGESGSFNDVFGSGRSIKSRADALRLAADAKKLRATIRANMAALGKARDAISSNMEFVRASSAGISQAKANNALSNTRDAAALADKLRSYIVSNVDAQALKEAGNLEPIISATLLESSPKKGGKK